MLRGIRRIYLRESYQFRHDNVVDRVPGSLGPVFPCRLLLPGDRGNPKEENPEVSREFPSRVRAPINTNILLVKLII